MKIIPVIIYIVVIIIAIISPAAEGYDTFLWKFIVGQIYAIPAFLITATIVQLIIKKRKNTH